MAEPKKSHKAVRYGKGMLTRHCGVCTHFQPPKSCKLVVSPVASSGWCVLFERAKVKDKKGG